MSARTGYGPERPNTGFFTADGLRHPVIEQLTIPDEYTDDRGLAAVQLLTQAVLQGGPRDRRTLVRAGRLRDQIVALDEDTFDIDPNPTFHDPDTVGILGYHADTAPDRAPLIARAWLTSHCASVEDRSPDEAERTAIRGQHIDLGFFWVRPHSQLQRPGLFNGLRQRFRL